MSACVYVWGEEGLVLVDTVSTATALQTLALHCALSESTILENCLCAGLVKELGFWALERDELEQHAQEDSIGIPFQPLAESQIPIHVSSASPAAVDGRSHPPLSAGNTARHRLGGSSQGKQEAEHDSAASLQAQVRGSCWLNHASRMLKDWATHAFCSFSAFQTGSFVTLGQAPT